MNDTPGGATLDDNVLPCVFRIRCVMGLFRDKNCVELCTHRMAYEYCENTLINWGIKNRVKVTQYGVSVSNVCNV